MYSLWQDLSVNTKFFLLCDLDLDFDLLLKKLNLGHNFWTKRDRAFIFHMCISCGKTCLLEPKFITSWPWPWLLTYFWKNLTLTIIFEPKVIGLKYYTYLFLVKRPSVDTNIFYLVALTLTLTYFWKNLNLLLRGILVPLGQTPI